MRARSSPGCTSASRGLPMSEASALLDRAAAHYDAPGSPLPALARSRGWRGFGGAGLWMAVALAQVRRRPVTGRSPARLGFIKYGLCTAAAAVAASLYVA